MRLSPSGPTAIAMCSSTASIILFLWSAVALHAQAAPGRPFQQCPPVGANTGCAILIVIREGGAVQLYTDPAQGPFDGNEDTLVGVQNNSSAPITNLTLKGTQPIFGFDGDGLCNVTPHPSGCPFGPTGYEGPGTAFTNIGPDKTSGTVSFLGGLNPGQVKYFGLEEQIKTVCQPLNVGRLRQIDAPWGSDRYDHTTKTIRAKGCWLTAAAMMINFHASAQGKAFRTNPGDLNNWLIGNNGYDASGSVKGLSVARYAVNNGVLLYYNGRGRGGFDLDNYLCTGNPVILSVSAGHHFVLATGQAMVMDTTGAHETYSINDPGHNEALPGNQKYLNLQGYDYKFDSLRLFSSTPPSSLSAFRIAAHSPVELLITDPQGRRLGVDPVLRMTYEEIPGGGCYVEQIDDDENPGSSEPESKICEFQSPLSGTYRLSAIGTGTGPFTIDVSTYGDIGNEVAKFVAGTALTGVSNSYLINYSAPTGTASLTIQCPGDINTDGVVNDKDVGIVRNSFGMRVGQLAYNPVADVNRDGIVNIVDLAFVSRSAGCNSQTR